MMIGTSLPMALARISRQTLTPSTPGSITSKTTRSTSCSEELRRFSASSPSATASVLMPSRSRASSTTPLTAGSSSTISIFGTRITLRQLDLNYGTHALFGLQRNAPAHPLHQVLADGQPQPEALGRTLFSGGFSPPVETFEDVGQVGIPYPRPFVLDDHGAVLQSQPDLVPTLGVLDGVANHDE